MLYQVSNCLNIKKEFARQTLEEIKKTIYTTLLFFKLYTPIMVDVTIKNINP